MKFMARSQSWNTARKADKQCTSKLTSTIKHQNIKDTLIWICITYR